MHKILIFILTLLIGSQTFGQTDHNGNPIFNSISTHERALNDFLLISNYYTLKNNIDNRQSSVFISEKPTLNQIEASALSLPSDFFILTKENKIVVMVMLQSEPKRQFMSIEMRTNRMSVFSCNLTGDITENRANEIIKEKYDPTASISDGKLKFNGKEFNIISNQKIEEAIIELIKEEELDKKEPSDIILPSRQELKNFILSKTKEGGELDFFTEIKGKEFDGVEIKPGVLTTLQSIAYYKWGRACFDIGVDTIEDVYEIFSEHKSRPLDEREKEYILMGFNKDWEK